MPKINRRQPTASRSRKKVIILVLCIILAVGIGVGGYALWQNRDSDNPKQPGTSTSSSKTQKGVDVTTTQPNEDGDEKTEQPTPKPGEVGDIQLIAPSGSFVSNHKPNLSGSPAPNVINSTCYTAPGVNCEIRFTKGSMTKTLGPNKTGSDGYVSWDWKLQDIGLSEGTWSITAVASHNGRTLSASDPVPLEVKP